MDACILYNKPSLDMGALNNILNYIMCVVATYICLIATNSHVLYTTFTLYYCYKPADNMAMYNTLTTNAVATHMLMNNRIIQ